MSLDLKKLLGCTALLGALSLPAFTQSDGDDPQPDPEPRRLLSAHYFHDKKSSFDSCPNPGDGCVVLVFSDGTVKAVNL